MDERVHFVQPIEGNLQYHHAKNTLMRKIGSAYERFKSHLNTP